MITRDNREGKTSPGTASDKQIEEMAKCCPYHHNGECIANSTCICECDLMCEMFGAFANLEKAGYRLASEVAREIFAEIQEKFKELTQDGKMPLFQALVSAVNTIENKYTEGEG